jgi:hypothetical protein
MSSRGVLGALALTVIVVLIVLLAGQSRGGGPPLDPDSTDELGTRALVELLGRYGTVDVIDGVPGPEHDTALLLESTDPERGEAELEAWVESGGRLVLFAGYASAAAPNGGTFFGGVDRGVCDIEALAGVEEIDVSTGTNLVARDGDTTCFGDGRQAFVVSGDRGDGAITTLGASAPLTNRYLDEADNAVLAVGLLAPSDDTSIALVRPRPVFEGGEGSLELLGPAFDRSIWQALVAFVILAFAAAIRFGRPVTEDMPARIAGSELVDAVGGLMQDADRPADAARTLRDAARADLGRLVSVDPLGGDDHLALRVASRTGREKDEVLAALGGPVDSTSDLVRTARTLEELRRDCRHVPGGTP